MTSLHLLLRPVLLLAAVLHVVNAITQTQTLIWTEKETSDGVVNIKGIPGDPRDWVPNGIKQYAISYFTDAYSRNVSHRVALAFRYAHHDLSFSDRGFKNIYRIYLQRADYVPYTYYLPLHIVYTGISTQVYGMAIDWLSGSIYWTDALYNWITVARLMTQNVFNHIVTTELDRPTGIAVHPQDGRLYWSDLGAVSKIERSRLDGTGRVIFVGEDLDKPLGLSVDYAASRLYWVDDFRHTIESVDLVSGRNRRAIHITPNIAANPKLFALCAFQDFIFASEQRGMTIMIFNKTTTAFIKHINAAIFDNTSAIPYDVTMYDLTVQENVDSDCRRLRCSDICISDGGRRAHCICRMGYRLAQQSINRCERESVVTRPMYIYSNLHRLCGTHIRITDFAINMAPILVNCFHELPNHRYTSLAFHIYADLLFFFDAGDQQIHRMRMETAGEHIQVIAANTGRIGGMSVDWIADNLYWTDEEKGEIIMSRLDGRYRRVLVRGLNRPKYITVNPLTGMMYWVDGGNTIQMAGMDGQAQREFFSVANGRFSGMVLDVRRDRLYWVDQSLPGIRSIRQNQTEHRVLLHTSVNDTVHDVTVYQNHFAWTDGVDSVFFGRKNGLDNHIIRVLRGIRHLNENASHDIITYDDYLQPPIDQNSSLLDLCDIDNDEVGCQQLCVLVRAGHRQCACSVGFYLADDQRSCISDRLKDNFLLFVDPTMKAMYQVDLTLTGSGPQQIRGIDLRTSNVPARVAYDYSSLDLYWHDNEFSGQNSIKRMKITGDASEHSLTILSRGHDVGNIEAVPTSNRLVFSEAGTQTLHVVDPANSPKVPRQLYALSNVVPSAIAVDRLTGDLYWVEAMLIGDNLTQWILSCNPQSCGNRSLTRPIVSVNKGYRPIVGLHVAIDCEWNVTFWTSTDIYALKVTEHITEIELLFRGEYSFNITNAVGVDDRVFFTDFYSNSVLMTSRDQEVTALTDPVFSRLTDLKAYRSPDWVPPPPVVGAQDDGVGLSSSVLGGVIAAGAALLIILIAFFIAMLMLVSRRRRLAKASYKSAAHDNPTYMSHRDVNANDGAAGSPIDLVFDAKGAAGVIFDADYEKKKKVPLDDEEALVTDSCYTQYDEKVDPPANDFEYDQVKAQLPGIEPPPVVEPQYINTKNQDDFPYMHM